MHGRKRSEYKAKFADPKISAALEQKAQQWNQLSQILLQQRRSASNSSAKANAGTLELTTKVLIVNPDPSWIWNMRRDFLLLQHPQQFPIVPELDLTATCLQRNPKAYGSWFHRKWVIQQLCTRKNSSGHTRDSNDDSSGMSPMERLDSELGLCYTFLKLDERNFHCWNYRRYIVGIKAAMLSSKGKHNTNNQVDGSFTVAGTGAAAGAADMLLGESELIMGAQIVAAKQNETETSNCGTDCAGKDDDDDNDNSKQKIKDLLQSEWNFSQSKIEENFSNCSAFHYRSKLLPFFFTEKADSLIQDELELVQNAIFTEPDDQTAWWYHRFLLDFASKHLPNDEFQNNILENEHELLSELVEEANGQCKWGLLALHMICTYQLKAIQEGDADEGSIVQKKEELNSYLDQLVLLDPDRKLRYATMKVV